jgi:hypothetical protein
MHFLKRLLTIMIAILVTFLIFYFMSILLPHLTNYITEKLSTG